MVPRFLLMRSFWLCKKANRKRALRYEVKKAKGKPPSVEFEIFEPKTDKEVSGGTVTRAKATCLCCGTVLPPERVRAQLAEQRGGADVVFDAKGKRTGGARMLAVVTLKPGSRAATTACQPSATIKLSGRRRSGSKQFSMSGSVVVKKDFAPCRTSRYR